MPHRSKPAGKLISFEGSEGSGKSTQIAHLARHLQTIGRDVISTREPGGTEIGEQIRNIIVHNSKGDEMCAETELLLFAASVVDDVISALVNLGYNKAEASRAADGAIAESVKADQPAPEFAALLRASLNRLTGNTTR